jgi:3-hydroxyisobutyrate dehydrogenase-like beta-hydroxyacid dehydrogenase
LLTDPGRSPALLVDFSTVSVEASAAVRDAGRKRETDFLAAPVSGNPKVVSAGTLVLEQARRSGIALAAENVKVDDGLEASS